MAVGANVHNQSAFLEDEHRQRINGSLAIYR